MSSPKQSDAYAKMVKGAQSKIKRSVDRESLVRWANERAEERVRALREAGVTRMHGIRFSDGYERGIVGFMTLTGSEEPIGALKANKDNAATLLARRAAIAAIGKTSYVDRMLDPIFLAAAKREADLVHGGRLEAPPGWAKPPRASSR